MLLRHRNEEWLVHQRAKWVPENSTSQRVSVVAGRTDTRCNIGRPQVRWEAGVELAEQYLRSRTEAIRGGNALTVGTRIRQALANLRSVVRSTFNDQDE